MIAFVFVILPLKEKKNVWRPGKRIRCGCREEKDEESEVGESLSRSLSSSFSLWKYTSALLSTQPRKVLLVECSFFLEG